jgi:hypothetical protein
MHAQRKPLSSTSSHLPQGTRRELRGQVIQWRAAAAKKNATPQAEQLLTPAMSKRSGDVGLALLVIGALLVVGLRMGGLL